MRDKSTYIIAEIGINHNGSLQNCLKMIDNASGAGCDCVKVQYFKAKDLYPQTAGRLDWKDSRKKYSYDIYKAVKSFESPSAWIKSLIKYCKRKKIDFLSSVFNEKGARYLMGQGLKALKLPSTALTNTPLIENCAQYGVPIFMSTGGATLLEIKEAVKTINKYHNKLSILHCSLTYPTKLSDCNLGVIDTLKSAFPHNRIGYSDHTKEVSEAAVQSVYLGAKIIEKHTTLDRNMKGPDHFFAVEPLELKKLVRDIRIAEKDIKKGNIKINKKIYGSSEKSIFDHEKYLREFSFMRLFSKRSIKKGEVIRPSDILILRPGKKKPGLEPRYLELFQKNRITAKMDLLPEDPIVWRAIL